MNMNPSTYKLDQVLSSGKPAMETQGLGFVEISTSSDTLSKKVFVKSTSPINIDVTDKGTRLGNATQPRHTSKGNPKLKRLPICWACAIRVISIIIVGMSNRGDYSYYDNSFMNFYSLTSLG